MDESSELCGTDSELGTNNPASPEPTISQQAIAYAFLDDVADAARSRLPRAVWDFADGGGGDEVTLAANRAALDGIGVMSRVLTGAPTSTEARLLNTESAFPIAVAPIAYQQMFHPDGELGMAEAAKQAGIPFALSTMASSSIEDVAAAGAHNWFQLYWLQDKTALLSLVRRAEDAGYTALIVTVDVPIMACRKRDWRNSFRLPDNVTAANLGATAHSGHHWSPGRSAIATHTNTVFESMLSWHDIEWIRERTRLPLALKGILHPNDAIRAAELGADAVVVSNHGGRQLDGAVPSVSALPAVADAVGDRIEVLLDSGVRSGTDVLRALALGARGVLVGRPVLWGLAAAGTTGVTRVLSILHDELREAMQLAGCPDVLAARQLTSMPMPGHHR